MSDDEKPYAEKQRSAGLEWGGGFAVLQSVCREGLTDGSQLGRDLKRMM